MAKLFGYPINVLAEEDEESAGGGSTNADTSRSRSATQPDSEAASLSAGLPQRETNPDPRFSESGSAPIMDSESDLDYSFIDFFGTVSYETESQRIARDLDIICGGFDDVMEEVEEEMQLGLGIGPAASSGELRGGDSVITEDNKETDPGRVGVGADLSFLEDFLFGRFEDDLFCQDGAMLNDITWDTQLFQAPLFSLEEEEELALPSRTRLEQNIERLSLSPFDVDALFEAMDDSSSMDMDTGFFLDMFPDPGEATTSRGDYYDAVFAESFNQVVVRARPASKRVVDELPVVEITSEELSKGRIVCAVCIGDVVVEEKVTRLPCRHYYHGECIVPWLGVRNTCPVCRFELPTDDLGT